MKFTTGETIYEQIISFNPDNINPVVPATFDIATYKNGALFTGLTVSISLEDSSRGVYSAMWSSSTFGVYQHYIKNLTTNVIFITDSVDISDNDELDQNIYIGL
ncbi:MAG TPA: hypothetical protein VLB82_00455 [Thermodesulfobacteriota bacterium]|nr:hypothetical protein [Thermodesulfobacteriota bacterium]